jgi:hypothetical protein
MRLDVGEGAFKERDNLTVSLVLETSVQKGERVGRSARAHEIRGAVKRRSAGRRSVNVWHFAAPGKVVRTLNSKKLMRSYP